MIIWLKWKSKLIMIKMLFNSISIWKLTILNIVAEVLSAEAGPDGGPGVLLCPGQGASGHGGDGVVWVTQEDAGRETLSVWACDSSC